MKVIGLDANGDYIAIIGKTEVRKVMDHQYYNTDSAKAITLRVNDEIDLSLGFDYTSAIKTVTRNFEMSHNTFISHNKTFINLIKLINGNNDVDTNSE